MAVRRSKCTVWILTAIGGFLPLLSAVSRTEFIQALLTDYDSRIPPSYEEGNATEVKVQLYVSSIDSIDESTMDFAANFFITQKWVDSRLMFFALIDAPYMELDAKMMGDVWVPDLYFANEKTASFHDITVPNKMMHLYSNGTVHYKARVSLTASCPMELHKYPMDTQHCSVEMRSFAYSQTNVIFMWDEEIPIQMSKDFRLPQFEMIDSVIGDCTNDTEEGRFSCIRATFTLQRLIGYYMIQLYIPSVLIVSLSWVSFCLSSDSVPARISLGILTVLTMTTQKSASTGSLPKVSYVKAIDVWMASCLVFVFAALLEYAVVNVLMRREVKRATTDGMVEDEMERGVEMKPLNNDTEKSKWIRDPHGKRNARMLDQLSRVMFPLAFVIFITLYWVVYSFH